MCNKEVHKLLIEEDYVNCVFCDKQIQGTPVSTGDIFVAIL